MYENMQIVGWREWAALPELGLRAVPATLDSSVRRSVLRVFDFGIVERRDSRRLRLWLGDGYVEAIEIPFAGTRQRPRIRVVVMVGAQRWPVEVSVRRGDGPPALRLGRDAVVGRLLIDPLREDIQGLPGRHVFPGIERVADSGAYSRVAG